MTHWPSGDTPNLSNTGGDTMGARPVPSCLIRTSAFFSASDRKINSPSAPNDTSSASRAIWRGGDRRSSDASQIEDAPSGPSAVEKATSFSSGETSKSLTDVPGNRVSDLPEARSSERSSADHGSQLP